MTEPLTIEKVRGWMPLFDRLEELDGLPPAEKEWVAILRFLLADRDRQGGMVAQDHICCGCSQRGDIEAGKRIGWQQAMAQAVALVTPHCFEDECCPPAERKLRQILVEHLQSLQPDDGESLAQRDERIIAVKVKELLEWIDRSIHFKQERDEERQRAERLREALEFVIDAAVTDADSCAICLQDIELHSHACAIQAARAAIAEYDQGGDAK